MKLSDPTYHNNKIEEQNKTTLLILMKSSDPTYHNNKIEEQNKTTL